MDGEISCLVDGKKKESSIRLKELHRASNGSLGNASYPFLLKTNDEVG